MQIMFQVLPDGKTGRVAFDSMGDRIYAEYQVCSYKLDIFIVESILIKSMKRARLLL